MASSAGIEGVTHLALEDLGIVRCIPNMTILCPSDALAVKQAVWASAGHHGSWARELVYDLRSDAEQAIDLQVLWFQRATASDP